MNSAYSKNAQRILRISLPFKKRIARLYRRGTVSVGNAVPHLFFHSLSMLPAQSFRGDNDPTPGFESYFVTVSEFKEILNRLYERGYVLVSLYEAAEPAKIKLPEGKKPVVLSFDDTNYYDYMTDRGFASRLTLSSDGRIANIWKDESGEEHLTFEGDAMPILESFVEAHPDFSHNGAKGVIALTGYEGVLGYRDPEAQRSELEPLVEALKQKGWLFASHSWGHHHRAYSNQPIFTYKGKRDVDRWMTEVSPYIGGSDIFITPFGIDTRRNARFDHYIRTLGFRYFCTISSRPGLEITGNSRYFTRIAVDGLMLQRRPDILYPYIGDLYPCLSPDRKREYHEYSLTAEGLVAHARRCLELKTVYLWGAEGEVVDKKQISRLKKDFPDYYDRATRARFKPFFDKGYRGFDCSGLLKCYVMGGLDNLRFDRAMDYNCASLFALSGRKGTIDTLPETPGICLYMEGHTALYEGGGSVIESTSNPKFGNGVVRTSLSDRPWTHWYEMPWVSYR